MSTYILSACWALQEMSSTQKLVLISLADQANDDGVCWPSLKKMSARTCLSERAIREAINWLSSTQILKISDRFNSSNVYTIDCSLYNPAPVAPPAPSAAPPLRQVPTNLQLEPTINLHSKKNSASEYLEEKAQVEKLKQGQFAKPDTFKMTFEWKPTANFETRCKVAGKDYSKFTDDILLSFINYNESREQYKTQKEWEGLLLNAFMRELAKPADKQQFSNQPKQPEFTPPVYKNWSDEPLPPADKKWGMTPEQLERLKKI